MAMSKVTELQPGKRVTRWRGKRGASSQGLRAEAWYSSWSLLEEEGARA